MSTNATQPSYAPLYQKLGKYLIPIIVLITGLYIFLPEQMPDITPLLIAFDSKGAYVDIIQARQKFLETTFLILGLAIGWHVISLTKSIHTWHATQITHLTDIRPLRDSFSSTLMMIMISYYIVNQMLPAINALPNSEWEANKFAEDWLNGTNHTYLKVTLMAYCCCSLFFHDFPDEYTIAGLFYKTGFMARNILLIATAKLCMVPMFITYLLFANLIVTAFACYHWKFAKNVIFRDAIAVFIRYAVTGVLLTPLIWIFCSISLPTDGNDIMLYPPLGLLTIITLVAFGFMRLYLILKLSE